MNGELRILGTAEIVSAGVARSVTRGHQERIFAALIDVSGSPVSDGVLIGAGWAGQPPRHPEKALQPEISRLRRAVAAAGGTIRHTTGGYLLDPGGATVDVRAFERLLADGCRALRDDDPRRAVADLTAALDLWRGPPFGDLTGEPFDSGRRRLDEQRLAARVALAEARLALGHHRELIAELEALAAGHPLHEGVIRHLVLALYRSGRQGDAMEAYHRLRREMATELGQPPGPELVGLYERILAQDPALRWEVPPARRVWQLPPANPKFSGREGVLDELGAALDESGAVALCGLPGIGKTQLALRYAHLREFEIVWWCRAESADLVDVSLGRLAVELGIAAAGDVDRTRVALRRALAGRTGWLLVFDNAERLEDLQAWLPPSGTGRILITSRNPDWEGYAKPMAVPLFDAAESEAFLRRRVGHDSPAVPALAERLGHLPLALEQASAFCVRTGEAMHTYLDLLDSRGAELLARGRTSDYDGTVAETWQIAFQRVIEDEPAAADLLRLCAFLAADDIPTVVLGTAAPHLADPLHLAEAVGALMRFSLVERRGPTLSVHRLVQELVRAAVPAERHEGFLRRLVAALSAAAPADPHALALWPKWDRHVPHIAALLGHLDAAGCWPDQLGELICRTSAHLDERGAYTASGRLLTVALALADRARPADAVLRARLLTEFARGLDRWGCGLHRAQDMLLEALGILEATPDISPLAIGRTLSRLAHALHCADLLTEALDAHRRALTLLRAVGDRRELSRALTDFGYSVWRLGDIDGAHRAFTEAIDLAEAELGARHPEVATARAGLAVVLQDAGRLADARAQLDQALDVLRAAHPDAGDDHLDIALTLDKLGYLLRLSGDVPAAIACHERAVRALSALFGPHDTRLAMALSNLGLDQLAAGTAADALRSQERALAIFTDTYGPDHTSTRLAAERHAETVRAAAARQVPTGK